MRSKLGFWLSLPERKEKRDRDKIKGIGRREGRKELKKEGGKEARNEEKNEEVKKLRKREKTKK